MIASNKFLSDLKKKLEQNGFVHIPALHFRSILIFFGASNEDLEETESGNFHSKLLRDTEPTMFFRQIGFNRVLLEEGKDPQNIDAHGVTQIQDKEICSEEGATVSYQRSGTRKWNKTPTDYSTSTVASAIGKLNDFLQPNSHHKQSHLKQECKIAINDQILIRVHKDFEENIAEPSPEGIHQDGNEITSVTLICRKNIKSGGESRLWSLNQPAGHYNSVAFGQLEDNPNTARFETFDWENCLFDKVLESPWETIYFNDRMLKHEVRKFIPNVVPCYRDVIVNFVRKPLLDGSDGDL